MQDNARLFPIEDVVSVLTGAPFNGKDQDVTSDLLSHVLGQPVGCANGSDALAEATGHLREQLPTELAQFRISDLARVVLEVKSRSGADLSRELVIHELRDRFGTKIPICTRRQFQHDSDGLKMLVEIARECVQSSTPTPLRVGWLTDRHTKLHENAKKVE